MLPTFIWLQVSDFGLTCFREHAQKAGKEKGSLQGSLHWMAPELLAEIPGADLILADVYAFGMCLLPSFLGRGGQRTGRGNGNSSKRKMMRQVKF